MSVFTIILIVIVAFLAGMEGVLDQWQFHQPLVACTLTSRRASSSAAPCR